VNADIVRALGATPGQVEGLARRASQLRASSKLEAFLLRETTDASCDA